MVEHRLVKRLQCHHCGLVEAVPEACPECGEAHSLVACGPGVERIAEEVSALFPDANVALVTSDTIHSPAQAKALVDSALAGEIDIFIGTQLITKGYHFPELTLVGVVDADLALKGGDLRAGERSFQQISQVAGRAGRGEKPGHVYIQTHQPEAPVLAALVAGDAPGFYAAETEARRAASAAKAATRIRGVSSISLSNDCIGESSSGMPVRRTARDRVVRGWVVRGWVVRGRGGFEGRGRLSVPPRPGRASG